VISAQVAISKAKRDLTLARALKVILIATAVVCIAMGAKGATVLAGLFAVWIVFTLRSARGSQMAADSTPLIAAGQFEEAEARIERSLRTFTVFGGAKLLSLHHLAVSRHAQRQWQDSVLLCRALLAQRLGSFKGLSRSSRLILADSLLELGDLNGAQRAINDLFGDRLMLSEALNLLQVQLDYLSRIGAWEQVLHQVGKKAQLAELMPTGQAARVQAYLALAAKKTGRMELESWLRRRVELLVDVQQLLLQRPLLKQLWA